jgi:hypothetical protein
MVYGVAGWTLVISSLAGWRPRRPLYLRPKDERPAPRTPAGSIKEG